MTNPKRLKIFSFTIAVAAYLFVSLGAASKTNDFLASIDFHRLSTPPPIPISPFSPSNARTEDGQVIPAGDFIPAARCSKCHSDVYSEWSESLHRNAAREPFYKSSVDPLEHQRGIEFTRHCESCHSPAATITGALTTGATGSRKLEDEGVTCTVCHSITETRLDGTGSYTIRRPALIVDAEMRPVSGDVSDDQILENIDAHKRAMMRPLLRQPEFCAACHKAAAPPELNNYKYMRGFNTYDEWQMSGASTETITPFYRREKRADCRTCHMPETSSSNDLAAKNGKVVSHRFLGANTITPHFYGQEKQVELTKLFLQDQVLSVDIFAVRNESSGKDYQQLTARKPNQVELGSGDTLTADVVVFNRKAAHSFPPELRDLYEPWVEFEAIDANGKTIFHSGFINPDKSLDSSAHVYKSVLLDNMARVLTRHQVWTAATKAYDNFIPSGRGDLVRYRFAVPSDVANESIVLRAKVNYRRFVQEYTDHVLRQIGAEGLDSPIVTMAQSSATLINSGIKSRVVNKSRGRTSNNSSFSPRNDEIDGSRRWNDYGIALLEQSKFGEACGAFKQAAELDPRNPDPLVNQAIAELRMERYATEKEQVKKAEQLIAEALLISPNSPRALFYRAAVWRSYGRLADAAEEFGKLAAVYPKDREIRRQVGQTLFALNRIDDARIPFESILSIDPTDAEAYLFLSSIYAFEGFPDDALRSRRSYLLWRDDPLSLSVAANFFVNNPQWLEVRVPTHVHSSALPGQPIAIGRKAVPDSE